MYRPYLLVISSTADEAALHEAVLNWRFYPAVHGPADHAGRAVYHRGGDVRGAGRSSRFAPPPVDDLARRHAGPNTSQARSGNSYARRLLVEAAWSYQHPARVSPDIQRRHEGSPRPSLTTPGMRRRAYAYAIASSSHAANRFQLATGQSSHIGSTGSCGVVQRHSESPPRRLTYEKVRILSALHHALFVTHERPDFRADRLPSPASCAAHVFAPRFRAAAFAGLEDCRAMRRGARRAAPSALDAFCRTDLTSCAWAAWLARIASSRPSSTPA
ncbi:hypothetical protein BX592_111109 [Paraburkholderia rhizosphaerae]|uniref:Uncharacterized protein n=1 Tax=Paraburkholderia rhizosphaerae TaxID=480658 RepID=A0A4R8LS01_9BURK|nr:hypothetical protein BX592_111109 [Paraburkholderia rhizosphaerae]